MHATMSGHCVDALQSVWGGAAAEVRGMGFCENNNTRKHLHPQAPDAELSEFSSNRHLVWQPLTMCGGSCVHAFNLGHECLSACLRAMMPL